MLSQELEECRTQLTAAMAKLSRSEEASTGMYSRIEKKQYCVYKPVTLTISDDQNPQIIRNRIRESHKRVSKRHKGKQPLASVYLHGSYRRITSSKMLIPSWVKN